MHLIPRQLCLICFTLIPLTALAVEDDENEPNECVTGFTENVILGLQNKVPCPESNEGVERFYRKARVRTEAVVRSARLIRRASGEVLLDLAQVRAEMETYIDQCLAQFEDDSDEDFEEDRPERPRNHGGPNDGRPRPKDSEGHGNGQGGGPKVGEGAGHGPGNDGQSENQND